MESPSDQSLELEIYDEALRRIVQISQKDVRQILEEAGGVRTLSFAGGALELQSILPDGSRVELLKHLDRFKGAIAHTCPAQKLVLKSPAKRSVKITIHPADESLIDASKTVKQQQQFKDFLRLEARCRTAMAAAKDLIMVTDRQGWCIDCNFTKPRFGIDRLEAIGELIANLFPHLADIAHSQLEEAFRYPEIPIYREFRHEILPGIAVRFRSRTIAYDQNEALTLVKPVGVYPWL